MSRLRSVLLDTAAMATVMVVALPAAASVTTESSYSAWAVAASPPITQTSTFDVNGSPAAAFMSVTGVTLADGTTLSFDGSSMTVAQVGEDWGSFCSSCDNGGSYNGQVLSSQGASSVDFTVSSVTAFGMYIEPANPFFKYEITLTLSDHQTVSQSLSGSNSAAFFGWVGAGVVNFAIASEPLGFSYSGGFGVGDFYSAQPSPGQSAPEPGSLAILAGTALGFFAARRRQHHRQTAPFRRRSSLSRYACGNSSRSSPSQGS